MSRMTHTSLFRRLLFGVALLLVPLAGAATAQADEAARCEGRVIEQPFTAWEDTLDYFLVPDGDFSAGAAGWGLADATLVEDNEPWNVHGSETMAAVRIENGGSRLRVGALVRHRGSSPATSATRRRRSTSRSSTPTATASSRR